VIVTFSLHEVAGFLDTPLTGQETDVRCKLPPSFLEGGSGGHSCLVPPPAVAVGNEQPVHLETRTTRQLDDLCSHDILAELPRDTASLRPVVWRLAGAKETEGGTGTDEGTLRAWCAVRMEDVAGF
jgi:hypothetical protein